MTKKHFIQLADMIKAANYNSDGNPYPFNAETIACLGAWCAKQNRAFKWERWVAYIEGKCGPNGGKVKVSHGTL
jgi:hypothetical protein